jgi:hypothetical protein
LGSSETTSRHRPAEPAGRDQEGSATMAKLLEVQIAPDDLEFLKSNQYLLCFAKMAANTSNPAIVWQCFSGYLQNNPFGWLPMYQVFGSSAFNVGGVATVDTGAMTIGLGQQATFTADAAFQTPVADASVPPNSFRIQDQYRQQIHFGFANASTGPDGVPRITPVFLTPALGDFTFVSFTPLDTVRVWFQQDVVTGSIVASMPNSIEISLATRDFGKLRYQGGQWSEQAGAWSDTM